MHRDDAPFAAILFDCDGVLVDSEAITNGVLQEMLHELGWPISESECVERFIGRSLGDEWAVILEHTGVRIDDAWLTRFRRRRDERLRHVRPVEGARAAVEAAAQATAGRIACVTGADRAKVEMQLRVTGLAELFGEHVFSGMEMPRTKPAPDVYLAAMTALRIEPASALVIEDSVAGTRAGVAAGATVFGYAAGALTSTSPAELIEAGATRTFAHMDELRAIVGPGAPTPHVRPR